MDKRSIRRFIDGVVLLDEDYQPHEHPFDGSGLDFKVKVSQLTGDNYIVGVYAKK